MTVKELFRFACDAPGCKNTEEIEAEKHEQPEVPEGWHEEEVGETRLNGCCDVHVCAAIVKELGYAEVAQAMMSLKAAKSAEPTPIKPESAEAQSNVTPIALSATPNKQE